MPEVAQMQGLVGMGVAHLLLGVHHWHPLEDTKGSVAHSHPSLLPVGGWGTGSERPEGRPTPPRSRTHLGVPAEVGEAQEGSNSFANGA